MRRISIHGINGLLMIYNKTEIRTALLVISAVFYFSCCNANCRFYNLIPESQVIFMRKKGPFTDETQRTINLTERDFNHVSSIIIPVHHNPFKHPAVSTAGQSRTRGIQLTAFYIKLFRKLYIKWRNEL